ncbi:MAG: hypothetical protein P1V97_37975, partial [Planctomycetota bacterium]|nr:hypothetical protein [Planctomycetota bacterium]
MTDHAQAFVNVVRAQGWLQPSHESLLASNPAAPWDALYQGGALGAEHVQWAIQQVQAQMPPPPNPAAAPVATPTQTPITAQAPTHTVAPVQAAAAVALQAAPVAAGAWEAAVKKHESGEISPPTAQELAPPTLAIDGSSPAPVARRGEMQALSLEDLEDTQGEIPSLSLNDLDSEPMAALGVPSTGLGADAKAVIDLIVENGMGTRSFLEQKFAVKKAVDGALETELSAAQYLVETLAVSAEEIKELARLTQNPLLEINPNSGAVPSMDDAIIEAKIQSGELDPGLRQSAQAAQQALKLLGIDRHETGLIRH